MIGLQKQLLTTILALTISTGSGKIIDQGDLQNFKTGVTTQNDVISKFGEPSSEKTIANGSTIVVYAHAVTKPGQAITTPTGQQIVVTSESTTFIFGADGKLKSINRDPPHDRTIEIATPK
jgi:hypothetical protein